MEEVSLCAVPISKKGNLKRVLMVFLWHSMEMKAGLWNSRREKVFIFLKKIGVEEDSREYFG